MASMLEIANCLRCLSADIVQKANSGHPGSPMGMAPVAAVLWAEVMKYNSANPNWPDRDRFVLSNGHACALEYALLHLSGYDMSMDDLKAFRQFNAKAAGHPERFLTPGVEVTTGPLGQGIANAVGLAIAEAHLAATFNRPGYEIVNHNTYVFCGDGCLMEGISTEALSLAGTLGLEKLTVVYDSNHICIDGDTALAFTEDHAAKYRALGFHVIEVPKADDDYSGLLRAFQAKTERGKPKMIILTTTIGYGSVNQGQEKVHGAPLGEADIAQMKKKFGYDPAKKFHVPEEVYTTFRKHVAKGKEAENAWKDLMARYEKAFPAEAAQFKAQLEGQLPAGWEDKLPKNAKSIATRKASENCLAALFPAIPALVGGSADLTPSNLTRPASAKLTDFAHGTPQGRYFHYGVREHAMVAVLNGIDAHGGLIPFGATFLNFVGYALGALRVAALCHHRAILVGTHDSIGLGEDGPTHQPVETVNMLRAMPNVMVIRPCDQNETSGAWMAAIKNSKGPTVLCLSRQNTVPQANSSIEGVMKGAYILQDAQNPQLIIISSGSEIGMCMNAAKTLSSSLRVRVVSMPCQEIFEAQSEDYRKSVLPDGVPVLSVEPYVSFGWEKYSHVHIGMKGYGLSGPIDKLYTTFGITPERIVKVGSKLAARFPNGSAPLKSIELGSAL